MSMAVAHIGGAIPANIEAEQALLGELLMNGRALGSVSGFLDPHHFGEEVHAEIYAVMTEMAKLGKPISPITVRDYLNPDQKVGEISLWQYLVQLAGGALGVGHVTGLGQAVRDMAMRRGLSSIGHGMAAWARNAKPGDAPSIQIADAEARLHALAADLARSDQPDEHDNYDALSDRIAERAASGGGIAGTACGIAGIDNRIGGFEPGDLVLIAARPGMGKTALAVAMARRAAAGGVGCGFDSIEMNRDQIRYRLISEQCDTFGAKVAYSSIRRGRLNENELWAIREAGRRLSELPLALITAGNRLADVPGHIRAARRFCADRGTELKLFFVDYLALLRPSDRYAGSRVNEVGEISAALKEHARREGVAMIALHQLNRSVETRDDKRPGLSDLRDSGSLEQDADVVSFVYREHYYLDKAGASLPKAAAGDDRDDETRRVEMLIDAEHRMELIVAKHRQGPPGTVRLWCDMATNVVRDEG